MEQATEQATSRSYGQQVVDQIAEKLTFLEGRADRFQGAVISLSRTDDGLIFNLGHLERYEISENRDGTWRVQNIPNDPGLNAPESTCGTIGQAQKLFIMEVITGIGSTTKQAGGELMLSESERLQLLEMH